MQVDDLGLTISTIVNIGWRMEQMMTPYEALCSAVEKAGSLSALARACGVSTTAVWKWMQSARRVSTEYVLRVEAATGVSRHLLRPDIYPREGDYALPASVIGEDQSGCASLVTAQGFHRYDNKAATLPERGAA